METPGVDNSGSVDAYPSTSDNANNYTTSGSGNLDSSKQGPDRGDVATGTGTGPNIDPATTGSTPGNITSGDNTKSDNYASKMESTPRGNDSAAGTTDSVVGDPSSGNQPKQKQQGADRPAEAPTGEQNDAVKSKKQDAEDAQNIDSSGPGPRPLEEVAKENGGDAAKVGGAGGAAGGNAGGESDDKPQSESHGEGTGEKYVKSSGVKADGGDFDAANAGAGREADRLLDEKGIQHGADAKDDDVRDESPDSGSGEKSGKASRLKEKIKAKLHKH
ncbi:hypothetical protein DH86_00001127 [Scytalidium sp. 3C]|nr:hypothetical protein DH86_00001127 [Scytalidium sp. 3C]